MKKFGIANEKIRIRSFKIFDFRFEVTQLIIAYTNILNQEEFRLYF